MISFCWSLFLRKGKELVWWASLSCACPWQWALGADRHRAMPGLWPWALLGPWRKQELCLGYPAEGTPTASPRSTHPGFQPANQAHLTVGVARVTPILSGILELLLPLPRILSPLGLSVAGGDHPTWYFPSRPCLQTVQCRFQGAEDAS